MNILRRKIEMNESYADVNSAIIDSWVKDGWEWGVPITHEKYLAAARGDWSVLLTPAKPVPREWLGELKGARILGLAAGGGQQMPVFAAAGAVCTVLDYSPKQIQSEHDVKEREGYDIEIVRADMTKPLPFPDESFDIVFHPVSNCYVEDVYSIWRECARVLRKGGRLLSGLDNGLSYAFNDEQTELVRSLPFNPLKDKALYEECMRDDWGIQFSHTIEEQIGGQIKAGFRLADVYGDIDPNANLGRHNIPAFWATLAIKE